MKALRNDREAHHVIAWGGHMSPNRLHAQGYRPKPLPKGNVFQRAMRSALAWFKPVESRARAPFFNDADMGF